VDSPVSIDSVTEDMIRLSFHRHVFTVAASCTGHPSHQTPSEDRVSTDVSMQANVEEG